MPVTHPRINVSTSGLLSSALATANNALFDTLGNADYQPPPIVVGAFEQASSEGAQETYAEPESTDPVSYWPRGTDRRRGAFGEQYSTIVNLDWSIGLLLHLNDLADDRSGGLIRQRVTNQVARFLELKERILIQIITAATDPDLLPAIPTDPGDGLALFSASHAWVTNGNIITGSGVATVNAILTDLFTLIERYGNIVDTASQPFFPKGVELGQLRILAGQRNRQVWAEALKAVVIPGGLNASSTISNVVVDQLNNNIHFTSRITDDDWFVYLDYPGKKKPLILQERQPVSQYETSMENSDFARDKKLISFDSDSRFGVGINQSRMFMKVNN